MSGDPTNAPIWAEADVLLGSLTATTPTAPADFPLNIAQRTASVGTTTTSPTVTGATFTAQDVGATITGTGIPALATIIAVTPGVNATISANATATATITATIGPVTDEWDFAGMLSDENPFDAGAESIDSTDHSAFGYGVYATTYKNQKEVLTFTALETSLITLGLIYDTSDLTDTSGTISGVIKRRDPSRKFLIALEARNSTEMERRVSKNYAYIDTIQRNMADGKKTYTVTVVIIPTSTEELFDYYKGPLS